MGLQYPTFPDSEAEQTSKPTTVRNETSHNQVANQVDVLSDQMAALAATDEEKPSPRPRRRRWNLQINARYNQQAGIVQVAPPEVLQSPSVTQAETSIHMERVATEVEGPRPRPRRRWNIVIGARYNPEAGIIQVAQPQVPNTPLVQENVEQSTRQGDRYDYRSTFQRMRDEAQDSQDNRVVNNNALPDTEDTRAGDQPRVQQQLPNARALVQDLTTEVFRQEDLVTSQNGRLLNLAQENRTLRRYADSQTALIVRLRRELEQVTAVGGGEGVQSAGHNADVEPANRFNHWDWSED